MLIVISCVVVLLWLWWFLLDAETKLRLTTRLKLRALSLRTTLYSVRKDIVRALTRIGR